MGAVVDKNIIKQRRTTCFQPLYFEVLYYTAINGRQKKKQCFSSTFIIDRNKSGGKKKTCELKLSNKTPSLQVLTKISDPKKPLGRGEVMCSVSKGLVGKDLEVSGTQDQ